MKQQKETPEFSDEQNEYMQEQIKAAQEERDYVNAVDRKFRDTLLQLESQYAQNLAGISLVDKFEVDSWQKEWNAFRERHGMPVLDFEAMKERAARRAQGAR